MNQQLREGNAALAQAAAKLEERWKGVSNQMMAILVEHFEGEVEISLPVFEKICMTPLATQPKADGDKIRITVVDPKGQPAIAKNPRRMKLDLEQQDRVARALAGVVNWLQRTGMSWGQEQQDQFFHDNPEWQAAVREVANLVAPETVRAAIAGTMATADPEPDRPKAERCTSCGWAYGEHKPGCENAPTQELAAAS